MSKSTRYFVFSKAQYARTGVAKAIKNTATRDEARAYKTWGSNIESKKLGIFDRMNNRVIR